MLHKEKHIGLHGTLVLLLALINAAIIKNAFIHNTNCYNTLVVTVPLLLVAILVFDSSKHST